VTGRSCIAQNLRAEDAGGVTIRPEVHWICGPLLRQRRASVASFSAGRVCRKGKVIMNQAVDERERDPGDIEWMHKRAFGTVLCRPSLRLAAVVMSHILVF
jgi:hypothetical protein